MLIKVCGVVSREKRSVGKDVFSHGNYPSMDEK
jgi:hypothetical protein